MGPTLPDAASEIDADWLDRALRAGGLDAEPRVVGTTAEPIDDAVGLMGEITRFTLEWDQPGPGRPETVVAKLPSALAENRALGVALGLYEVEHQFYERLGPAAGIPTPRCWFTGADPAAGRYAILLDDLGDHDRYDQLDGAPPEAAQAAVDALAEFHARWWGGDDPALDWVPPGLGEALAPYGEMIKASWPEFAANSADLLTTADLNMAGRFVERWDHLVELSTDHPVTLCHRDYRIDNMLFTDGDPVVFDWTGAALANGLYDITYFLAGSLTVEACRADGAALLARYLDGLDSGGVQVDGLDIDALHRANALFCLVVPIMAGGHDLDTRDAKGDRLVAEGLLRLFSYLRDVGAVDVLD